MSVQCKLEHKAAKSIVNQVQTQWHLPGIGCRMIILSGSCRLIPPAQAKQQAQTPKVVPRKGMCALRSLAGAVARIIRILTDYQYNRQVAYHEQREPQAMVQKAKWESKSQKECG